MEDFIADLLARSEGPLHLRLLLQPCVALFFGIKDGLKDVKTGGPPYAFAILTTPREQRRALIKDGWQSFGKVFTIAFILDCIYQFKVYSEIELMEAITIAILLTAIPYMLLRGGLNRVLSRRKDSE